MNKAEFLRLHQPFLKNGELNQSFESDLNLLLEQYAQHEKEKYAYQQAMAYEEWLCENGYTKTISARPDYLDFFNHQNKER